MAAAVRDGGRRRAAGRRRNDDRASGDCRTGARRWNARASGGDRRQRRGRRRPSPTSVFDAGRHAHHLDFRSESPASGVDALIMRTVTLSFNVHDRLRLDRSCGDGRAEPGAAGRTGETGANHQATGTPTPTPPAMTSSQKRALGAHRAATRIQRRARARRHPGHGNARRRAAGRAQGARRHAGLPAVQVVPAARRLMGHVLWAATNGLRRRAAFADRTASAARRCSVKCCVDPRSRSTS